MRLPSLPLPAPVLGGGGGGGGQGRHGEGCGPCKDSLGSPPAPRPGGAPPPKGQAWPGLTAPGPASRLGDQEDTRLHRAFLPCQGAAAEGLSDFCLLVPLLFAHNLWPTRPPPPAGSPSVSRPPGPRPGCAPVSHGVWPVRTLSGPRTTRPLPPPPHLPPGGPHRTLGRCLRRQERELHGETGRGAHCPQGGENCA